MKRVGIVVGFVFVACGDVPPPSVPAVPPASASSAPPKAAPARTEEDCGELDRPKQAWAGATPELPAVPQFLDFEINTRDAKGTTWTVRGAVYTLRSRYNSHEVTGQAISVVGVIVDTNIARAPKCAWHKTGVRDPENCDTEIPSFTIADAGDVKNNDAPAIRVLGWASNFAHVFDATQKYKGLTARPKDLYKDEIWQVDVPYPLPAVGTKVKVTGRYGFTFTKSSRGISADPKNGILTYESLEVVP